MDISRYLPGPSPSGLECPWLVFRRHYVLGVGFVFVMDAGNGVNSFFRRNTRFVDRVVMFGFLVDIISLHNAPPVYG